MLGEERRHLLGGLEIGLGIGAEHPRRIVEILAGLEAEEHVVRVVILGLEVMAVVRRDERDPGLRGELRHLRDERELFGNAVILDLEIEAPGPENRGQPFGERARLLPFVGAKKPRNASLEAAAHADQPARAGGEQIEIDARTIVEALDVRDGRELDEVAVPLLVHDEEREMIVAKLPRRAALFLDGPLGDIRLHADDRLDAGLPRRLEKRNRAEQVPVVGERDGAHTHPLGGLDEILDPDRAVEKAVLRVVVKMYETRGRHAAVLLQALFYHKAELRRIPISRTIGDLDAEPRGTRGIRRGNRESRACERYSSYSQTTRAPFRIAVADSASTPDPPS